MIKWKSSFFSSNSSGLTNDNDVFEIKVIILLLYEHLQRKMALLQYKCNANWSYATLHCRPSNILQYYEIIYISVTKITEKL